MTLFQNHQSVIAPLLVCSLAGYASDARTGPDQVRNEAELALNAYVDAINRGDTTAAGAFYDRDADFHWIDQGKVQYRSAEQAIQSLQSVSSQGSRSVFTLEDPIVAELGDQSAITSVQYSFEVRSAEGASLFGWQGWMTIGWVKRDDGWKIAAGQAGPSSSGEVTSAASPSNE